MIPGQKVKWYTTHVCLTQVDKLDQTSEPVMVSCEFDSHWRQFYFLHSSRMRAVRGIGRLLGVCLPTARPPLWTDRHL